MTKNLDWKIGRNLDAFNDVLRGGFGAFEYEEPIAIVWEHSDKSKSDLGYPETIKWLERKLRQCHPSYISSVKEELLRALGSTFVGAISSESGVPERCFPNLT